MGAHSTLVIKRSEAVKAVAEHIFNEATKSLRLKILADVAECEDKELEETLDEMLDDHLYNALVVSDQSENTDRLPELN